MKNRIKTALIITSLFFISIAFLFPQETGAKDKIRPKDKIRARERIKVICSRPSHDYDVVQKISTIKYSDLKPILSKLKFNMISKRLEMKKGEFVIIKQNQAEQIYEEIKKIQSIKLSLPPRTGTELYALTLTNFTDDGRGTISECTSDNINDCAVNLSLIKKSVNTCIQSNDGDCAISDTEGNYVIYVTSGTHSFTYRKKTYKTFVSQPKTINGPTELPPVILEKANHSREIYGQVTWNKSANPGCVEVTLYRWGCTPVFYKSVKTCSDSAVGYYSFGEIADDGTYMVEISNTICNTWTPPNCDGLVIPNPNNEAHICNLYGTQCP